LWKEVGVALSFDYSAFLGTEAQSKETDPELLFQTLKVRDPKVERLWGEQVDALRGWKSRASRDALIQLNTGAGKTLVGLLIAQSLINKTAGHVVYLCSTNQLVKQTAEKADLYGLEMSTYISGEFSNDGFESGRSACTTSYASLFNGFTAQRGRFKDFQLAGIIFDDAHTAESIIRSSYTLSVARSEYPDVYERITGFYLPIYEQLGTGTSYQSLIAGKRTDTLLAPQYVTASLRPELTEALSDYVERNDKAKYAWRHLMDVVDLCAVIITGSGIEIAPAFIPIANHFAFRKDTERVYLSATLDASDAFTRTFGNRNVSKVSASANAGDGERLIIFPSAFKDRADEDYIDAKALASRKTLISVPTYRRAEVWSGFATLIDSNADVDEELTKFKEADDDRKIVLVARYDGLDLPEDRCRMMIIDESPSGASFLEHFLYERLGLLLRLQSTVASRIVQSFGRICRGVKDHGCFILTGPGLMQWLKRPANQARLPKFLRRQLTRSFQLSSTVADSDAGKQLTDDFFARAKEGDAGPAAVRWAKVYETFMKDWQKDDDPTPVTPTLVNESKAEVLFSTLLFARDYAKAANVFGEIVDSVFAESTANGAWIAYWLGFVFHQAGDTAMARHYFGRAHGASNGVLARPPIADAPAGGQFSLQIQNVAGEFNLHQEAGKLAKLFARVSKDLAPLKDVNASPNQHAESVRALGQYLGLMAFRPDPGESGPDVHWFLPGAQSFGMELKTHKDRSPCYTKDELGQIEDHLRWARESYADSSSFECVFVGPDLPACKGTTPGESFYSIAIDELAQIGARLCDVMRTVCATTSPLEFMPKAHAALKDAGLLYDDLVADLNRRKVALPRP
jgi:hypothetical protein